MDNERIGRAGSLESNDLMVTVDLTEKNDLQIELQSTVKEKFGKQLLQVVKSTLAEMEITKGRITVVDKGALDFAVRARVKTAVNRARKGNLQ